jgi:uncharacterized membrane protein YhaH (DUF805 family)
MKWFTLAFARGLEMSGRSSRREYWWFILVYLLLYFAAVIIDLALGWYDTEMGAGIITMLMVLVCALPSFTISARRLHDTNHSAWWMLAPITIIGVIPYLIFLLTKGTPGVNRFGPPYGEEAQSAPEAREERPCPFCAEPVLAEARRCKHCQSEIAPVSVV